MNIYLRTTYRGRMRDMKRILVVKAMVLGAIACSISAIGVAAGVESTHIQDATNTQQNIQGTEKHDAVQFNWMDRTDIMRFGILITLQRVKVTNDIWQKNMNMRNH